MRRLLLAAALLATTGCMTVPPPGDHPVRQAISRAMPPCRGPLDVAQVVSVVIPDHFDPADVPRDVTFHSPAEGDGGGGGGGHDHAAAADGDPSLAPFDIDLRPLDSLGGHRARIEIVLKDPRYAFFEWRDAAGAVVEGVADGEDANPFGFCGAEITTESGFPTAVFYVRIHPPSGRPDGDQPYKIGVAPRRYPDLGYIIDPNVKNRG